MSNFSENLYKKILLCRRSLIGYSILNDKRIAHVSSTAQRIVKESGLTEKHLYYRYYWTVEFHIYLLRGIHNIAVSTDEQKESYTKGYNQALADRMVGKPKREAEMTVGEHLDHSRASQHSQGYGLTA